MRLLRTRPEHFPEIVEEAEGTPEREAVLKYIKTTADTRRLVELYARDMLDNVSLRGSSEVLLAFRGAGQDAWVYTYDSASNLTGGRRCNEERLRVVHSLLDEIDVESVPEFALGEYRDLRLLVRRQSLPGMPQRSRQPPPPPTTEYVCTVRAAPGATRVTSGLVLPPFLRRSGTPSTTAGDAAVLVKALSSPSAEVREGALRATVALGQAKLLDSSTVREALETSEIQLGLLESIVAGPEDTRRTAVLLLRSVRRKDEEIVTRLSRRLMSSAPDEAEMLLAALEPMGPSGAHLVPTLARLFDQTVKRGRIDMSARIAWALGGIGPRAAGAVPSLRSAIQHPDKNLRAAVMKAFAQIGPPARTAVPDLVEVLKIRNRSLRLAALEASGSLKPGTEVVPALVRCLRHGDSLYRDRLFLASDVLCQIGEPAVPSLIEALSHKHSTVRQGAAEALAHMGERARDAVPALEKTLQDQKIHVRVQAAVTLCSISGAPEAALEILRAALGGDDGETRLFALHCLAVLSPPPTPLTGDLVSLIKAGQNEREALHLAAEIGPGAVEAVPILLERLSQEDGLTDAFDGFLLDKRFLILDREPLSSSKSRMYTFSTVH